MGKRWPSTSIIKKKKGVCIFNEVHYLWVKWMFLVIDIALIFHSLRSNLKEITFDSCHITFYSWNAIISHFQVQWCYPEFVIIELTKRILYLWHDSNHSEFNCLIMRQFCSILFMLSGGVLLGSFWDVSYHLIYKWHFLSFSG